MVVVYNYDARPTPSDRQGEVLDTWTVQVRFIAVLPCTDSHPGPAL